LHLRGESGAEEARARPLSALWEHGPRGLL